MLAALMSGQSLTATELAYCANITRSTASGHLTRLTSAGLRAGSGILNRGLSGISA
jgi:predicted transcriptional regulator